MSPFSCVAAALSTAALASRVGTTAITKVTVLRASTPPSFLPARQRHGQLSMSMGSFQGNEGNSWWKPAGADERSAAYRAHQRALRNSSYHQAQPTSSLQSQPFSLQSQLSSAESKPSMLHGLEAAWVIIFNAGQQNEGIYTHTQQDQGTSVLAFECTDDADRFGQQLLAKGFGLATPLSWSAGRLTKFCGMAGLEVSIVPRGTLPTPPSEIARPPTTHYRHHYDPFYQLGGTGNDIDPKHTYQRSGTARRDPYITYRLWLEKLFPLSPDNCDDEDCHIR
mmetsp:Transcript_6669/g.11257  ORF Transcript_6669/g.11257 Transcript_6669/m.11257 type:complete len:280 (-) Transcript_6669:190-1029(-)|eukprot:CAMPEP_0119310342 /NCGR_PEP_ID=MMETSP1333-20130426/18904_1 /TAXON_ID=418940 /ORGANISM="Scyphosphaera apsteinii, Strain RCC1455" /LENGTH=279 /DNA_ID=CAMNT_0007314511 /DNA_START=23 /DNA_END=862 /DNA_ORIENTATION=-